MDLPEPRKWFTIPQARTYTGRGRRQIVEALTSGELVGYQNCRGGTWHIEREDLDAWMRGHVAPTKTPSPAGSPRLDRRRERESKQEREAS